MNRRGFLLATASALAAPAIVRAEFIMPVTKIWTPKPQYIRFRRYNVLSAVTKPLEDGVLQGSAFFDVEAPAGLSLEMMRRAFAQVRMNGALMRAAANG